MYLYICGFAAVKVWFGIEVAEQLTKSVKVMAYRLVSPMRHNRNIARKEYTVTIYVSWNFLIFSNSNVDLKQMT